MTFAFAFTYTQIRAHCVTGGTSTMSSSLPMSMGPALMIMNAWVKVQGMTVIPTRLVQTPLAAGIANVTWAIPAQANLVPLRAARRTPVARLPTANAIRVLWEACHGIIWPKAGVAAAAMPVVRTMQAVTPANVSTATAARSLGMARATMAAAKISMNAAPPITVTPTPHASTKCLFTVAIVKMVLPEMAWALADVVL